MSNEKQASEAVALKEAGNQCYKNSDVPGALENYTKAIGTFENKYRVPHLKLGNYGSLFFHLINKFLIFKKHQKLIDKMVK